MFVKLSQLRSFSTLVSRDERLGVFIAVFLCSAVRSSPCLAVLRCELCLLLNKHLCLESTLQLCPIFLESLTPYNGSEQGRDNTASK